jgi:hypothetical protein
MVANIAVARKLLSILNALLGDQNHGNTLDAKDSRSRRLRGKRGPENLEAQGEDQTGDVITGK